MFVFGGVGMHMAWVACRPRLTLVKDFNEKQNYNIK